MNIYSYNVKDSKKVTKINTIVTQIIALTHNLLIISLFIFSSRGLRVLGEGGGVFG